ncbi:MAG: polyribonucleotide nucleotidyltransferase [Pirellulaceae bacterium]|nr:polyribonucleotide nucleotidyltransferase [Pirellulaceae bacterium]
MEKIRVEKKIGDKVLFLETGFLAKQADAAVIAGCGDTHVFNAVTSAKPREGIDFFPLMCDYRERFAAAGKFPGGFIKREGRPSTKETLTSRIMDRPLRPRFPKWFKNEVQCQSVVLSCDRENDGDVIAMNGMAAAVHISSLPFAGPVSSIRLGRVDGEYVVFPTQEELAKSDLDLVISGDLKSVCMIEGFAKEMPEAEMLDAIDVAHGYIKEVCELQQELYEKVNVVKAEYTAPEEDGLLERLTKDYYDQLKEAESFTGKLERYAAVDALKEKALAEIIPDASAEGAICKDRFNEAWHDFKIKVVREMILDGKRPDGRSGKDLRAIECHTGMLPRTHGSAVFQRGETQALVSVTLGTGRDEQRVEGVMEEYTKRFMLDYNFPSFSVGECRPNRGPGRREIGHGALAERSVQSVLPAIDDFPYTIRVISDILESNGSSSMATVCATILGLMDAGVPITNPVAGISVGVVIDGDRVALLTDILGEEDHYGDMDFKIAGTQNGITGIQLDLKIDGISMEVIKATLDQSREARIEILRSMLGVIRSPKEEISVWAPRMERTQISPEKIGALIGPGGKVIRAIQETTETVIEVDDTGRVLIAGTNHELVKKALESVEGMCAPLPIGKVYDGKVVSIKDFGLFIELFPGREGLCHVSELSNGFVQNIDGFCEVGEEMKVMVIDIDDQDRIKLSRKRAIEELGIDDPKADLASDDNGSDGDLGRDDFRGGGRRPRGNDSRRRGNDRGGDRGDRQGAGGRGGSRRY